MAGFWKPAEPLACDAFSCKSTTAGQEPVTAAKAAPRADHTTSQVLRIGSIEAFAKGSLYFVPHKQFGVAQYGAANRQPRVRQFF